MDTLKELDGILSDLLKLLASITVIALAAVALTAANPGSRAAAVEAVEGLRRLFLMLIAAVAAKGVLLSIRFSLRIRSGGKNATGQRVPSSQGSPP